MTLIPVCEARPTGLTDARNWLPTRRRLGRATKIQSICDKIFATVVSNWRNCWTHFHKGRIENNDRLIITICVKKRNGIITIRL